MANYLRGGAVASILLSSVVGSAAWAQLSLLSVNPDRPPNATPGHCYGEVETPARYQSYRERVVTKPQRSERRVIPAVTTRITKQVLVARPRVQRYTVPATYRTVTVLVVVKPAVKHVVRVPAQYEAVSEQILVHEARSVWKRSSLNPQDIVGNGATKVLATGEVMCLVEEPAEYRTVTRQVLKAPESTHEEITPAVTAAVVRRIIDRPRRLVERQIPAVYGTITFMKIVTPQHVENVTVPANYTMVTKQRLVAQSAREWREVACAHRLPALVCPMKPQAIPRRDRTLSRAKPYPGS